MVRALVHTCVSVGVCFQGDALDNDKLPESVICVLVITCCAFPTQLEPFLSFVPS